VYTGRKGIILFSHFLIKKEIMMKKIMTFFAIISLLFISTNSISEEFLSSVANNQHQQQFSVIIPTGNGQAIAIGVQGQGQRGIGSAGSNSYASDGQSQNSTTNGSSLTAIGSGNANDGGYRYMNQQGSITLHAVLIKPSGIQDVSGVVGGMGAITQSIGNANSSAGGTLENGDWSMSNHANSMNKPISVNVDGILNY